MPNYPRFILTDESVNSYGFRLLMSGLSNLEQFQDNPIMLFNHVRPGHTKDAILAIGTWKNIKVEKGRLVADPEFDLEDDFAQKIAGKVERKVYRAASVGIRILETSDNASLKTDGQQGFTVTKWEIREASVTDIPSNKSALTLYDADDNVIELSDFLSTKEKEIENSKPKKMNELQFVAGLLGLPSDANLSNVQDAITKLRSNADQVRGLQDQVKELSDQIKEFQADEASQLFDTALSDGRVREEQRQEFVNLFEKDFESTKRLLKSLPKIKNLHEVPDTGKTMSNDIAVQKYRGKTFSEWRKDDAKVLRELKDSDPETFKALYKSEFNKEYKESR